MPLVAEKCSRRTAHRYPELRQWLLSSVGGGLEGRAVTCLAVGLAFTVAVAADGTAWQMGETGVSGKGAPWEGALVPAKVTSTPPPLELPPDKLQTDMGAHAALHEKPVINEACGTEQQSSKEPGRSSVSSAGAPHTLPPCAEEAPGAEAKPSVGTWAAGHEPGMHGRPDTPHMC